MYKEVIIKNEKLLGRLETFLDDMFFGLDNHLPFQITTVGNMENDDIYWKIGLSELAVNHLLGFDHDCKNGQDSGCSYCGLLADLDLIGTITSPKDVEPVMDLGKAIA